MESIYDYAAVVLESDAIDAGIVSRQALLDYVARGGGLLVIARAGAMGAVRRNAGLAGTCWDRDRRCQALM